MIKISKLKVNPDNPRLIKDDKFRKLVESIRQFPQMMVLRPIIVDESYTILGGNMRFRAVIELGMKEIPDDWVKVAKKLTDEQKKEFLIKDNLSFGAWEWDTIANEWDIKQLNDWGMDMPWIDNNINFKPNTSPGTGGMNVTDEHFLSEQERLENQMINAYNLLTVSCPHCGQTFEIDKPKQ